MRIFVIVFSVALGIIVGFIPHFKKGKNIKFKLGTVIFVCISIFLTVFPPLASNLYDAKLLLERKINEEVTVACKIQGVFYDTIINAEYIVIQDLEAKDFSLNVVYSKSQLDSFNSNDTYLLKIREDGGRYYLKEVVEIAPAYFFPYIPALGNYIRLMNFHVPMAWVSVLAFFLSMLYSVKYLKTRDFEDDVVASASAFWGLIFCLLATVSGMIWAKLNWGAYWNWDPRQTSIFILMLIYFAYFSLRMAIENIETKARLSAVYSILAFVTVPFLVFLLPRLAEGLHPGSSNDETVGPILSGGSGMLNDSLLVSFALSLFSTTMLFFWLLGDKVKKDISLLHRE